MIIYRQRPDRYIVWSRIVFFGSATLCALALVFLVDSVFHVTHQTRTVTPIPSPAERSLLSFPTITSIPTITATPKHGSSLGNVISLALSGSTGEYGIVVKNLGTGEEYARNEHHEFATASLYKLWVMATVYEQIEKGDITPEQILSDTIPNLNRKFGISPEDAELTNGSISQSVSEALRQMITISHNYSAMLLSAEVKLSNVQKFLDSHGFSESRVGTLNSPPVTTASDMEKFFTDLLEEKLGTKDHTTEMLDLLSDQQINRKLPKYLPESVNIAHKTGELGSVTHDVGVVTLRDNQYIIVILSDTSSPAAAEDRIARISEKVYEYFH